MISYEPLQPKVEILYNDSTKETLQFPWVKVKRITRTFAPEVGECQLEFNTGNIMSDISPDGGKVSKLYQYKIDAGYQGWLESLRGSWIKVSMPYSRNTLKDYVAGSIATSDLLPVDSVSVPTEYEYKVVFIGRIFDVIRNAGHLSEVIQCTAVDILGVMDSIKIQSAPVIRHYSDLYSDSDTTETDPKYYLYWSTVALPPFNRKINGGVVGNKSIIDASTLDSAHKQNVFPELPPYMGRAFNEYPYEKTEGSLFRENWTNEDIAEYLIQNFNYHFSLVLSSFGFSIDENLQTSINLNTSVESIDQDGKSYLDVYQSVASRKNGLGTYLDYTEDKIQFHVVNLKESTGGIEFSNNNGYPVRLYENRPIIRRTAQDVASHILIRTQPTTLVITTNLALNYQEGWNNFYKTPDITSIDDLDKEELNTMFKEVWRKYVLKNWTYTNWNSYNALSGLSLTNTIYSQMPEKEDTIKALNFALKSTTDTTSGLYQSQQFSEENMEILDSLPFNLNQFEGTTSTSNFIEVKTIGDPILVGNSDIVILESTSTDDFVNAYEDNIIKSVKGVGRSITIDTNNPDDLQDLEDRKSYYITIAIKIAPLSLLVAGGHTSLAKEIKVIEDDFVPILIPKNTLLGTNEDGNVFIYTGDFLSNKTIDDLYKQLTEKANFFLKQKIKLELSFSGIWNEKGKDIFGKLINKAEIPVPSMANATNEGLATYENYSLMVTNSYVTKIVYDFDNQQTFIYTDYFNYT